MVVTLHGRGLEHDVGVVTRDVVDLLLRHKNKNNKTKNKF